MFRYGWKLLVLLLIAAVIFVWLIKAPIVSNYLTKKIGVPVTVRSVNIWPSQSTLHHFRISNPAGYSSKTAFEVDETVIDYRFKALKKNPHEIDLINLNDVFLNIIINNKDGSDNNWADIGANMPERNGSEEVIIHKLVMNRLTVKVEGSGAKQLGVAGTRYFERMEFDDIDSRDGFPTKELINNIFQGLGLKILLKKLLNPGGYIQKAANPWHIFGKAPEVQGLESDPISNPFLDERQHELGLSLVLPQ